MTFLSLRRLLSLRAVAFAANDLEGGNYYSQDNGLVAVIEP